LFKKFNVMTSSSNKSLTKTASKTPCAIITGASSGVGQACSALLASKGFNLVLNYASNDAGAAETKALCEAYNSKVVLLKGNIADEKICIAIANKAQESFGRVDALVNNAGTTKFCNHHDLQGLDVEDFQRIYAVNTIAPFLMVRAVQTLMKEQGSGAIVNVASTAGLNGIGSSIAYCASKAALLNMTKSLARVLGPEVRINAVCPGFIQGDWLKEGLGEETYEKIKAKTERQTPLGSTTTAKNIAEAIVMLIEGPRLMTGEYIVVDGGKYLS
jgi:3-oxoacyl-[acyl-carrier protein] reductase